MPIGKAPNHPKTVAAFLQSLPDDRRSTIEAVRKVVKKHLPKGYDEGMGWGMIMYAIPLSRFPNTYNGQPLCYVALGSHASYCSLYLMAAYGNAKQAAALKDGFK